MSAAERFSRSEMASWAKRSRILEKRTPSTPYDFATHFLSYLGGRAVYCQDSKQWLVLAEDGIWERDGSDNERMMGMLGRFEETLTAWSEAEAAKGDKEVRKKALELQKAIRSVSGAASMRHTLFMAAVRVAERLDAFDSHPDLIGTSEGVWDLRGGTWTDIADFNSGSGEYREPADFRITMRTASTPMTSFDERFDDYDPDPRWARFVSEVMCGDAEMADYLQRALGYSVFGDNAEEVMFVAYGPTTRNGKSVLLNSVVHAMGDYATVLPPAVLVESRRDEDYTAANPALCSTVGKRLVVMGETRGDRQILDVAKIKAYTGCDTIKTRQLHGTSFDFKPKFTMWLHCNALPQVNDSTVFSSGRIRVIPFERHFEPGEQDKSLTRRFESADGARTVLTWLFEGYTAYRRRGLRAPAKVTEATRAYREEHDPIDMFVEELCVQGAGLRAPAPELYRAYKGWFVRNGLTGEPCSAIAFGRDMGLKGFRKDKKIDGTMHFSGIRMKGADDE